MQNVIKTITAVLVMIFLSTISMAQENNYNRQVGVDISSFVRQFFNTGSVSGNQSSYFFFLKKYKENKNTRFGLGGDLDLRFPDNRSSIQIDFKLGTEKYKDFGKHWRALYGVDSKYGFGIISNNNGNNALALNIGAAPFLGLQFRMNDRLSLATETAFNFWLGGQFQDELNDFSLSTSFDPPIGLLLQVDFVKEQKE